MTRVRIRYTKLGFLKFISHLDTADLLRRAIKHSGADIAYSQGYNPHMLLSFANPLPLGVSSEFEIFDMTLNDQGNLEETIRKINDYLPSQIQILDYKLMESSLAINGEYRWSLYEFEIPGDYGLDSIDLDLSSGLIQKRLKKRGKRKVLTEEDISPYVKEYQGFDSIDESLSTLRAVVETSLNKTINPNRFIEAIFRKYNLPIDVDQVFIHKKTMFK